MKIICVLRPRRVHTPSSLHLRMKAFAARLDLLTRRRIDHVVVIRGDLVMQALWRVREKVPVLVHGAALHWHAIPDGGDGLVEPGCAVDDEELGPPQLALDEIVDDGTPRLGALATHA